MDNRHVIIERFFNVGVHGDISLAEEDLGWQENLILDAQTDWP